MLSVFVDNLYPFLLMPHLSFNLRILLPLSFLLSLFHFIYFCDEP